MSLAIEMGTLSSWQLDELAGIYVLSKEGCKLYWGQKGNVSCTVNQSNPVTKHYIGSDNTSVSEYAAHQITRKHGISMIIGS